MTLLENHICKKCNGEGYLEINRSDERFSLHLRLWSTLLVTMSIIGYAIFEATQHHFFWWLIFIVLVCSGIISGTIDKLRDLASPAVRPFARGDISQLLFNLIVREVGTVKGTLFCELLILVRDHSINESVVTEDN